MKNLNIEETFTEIAFEKHDLYHRTNAKIDVLDESFLEKDTEYHPNGALGLWCSTLSMKSCFGFGKNSYKIVFKNDRVINFKGWNYTKFYHYCCGKNGNDGIKTRKEYIQVRKYLIKNNIDVIYITDSNSTVNEVIILNYECVDKLVESFDVPNKKFWLTVKNS